MNGARPNGLNTKDSYLFLDWITRTIIRLRTEGALEAQECEGGALVEEEERKPWLAVTPGGPWLVSQVLLRCKSMKTEGTVARVFSQLNFGVATETICGAVLSRHLVSLTQQVSELSDPW